VLLVNQSARLTACQLNGASSSSSADLNVDAIGGERSEILYHLGKICRDLRIEIGVSSSERAIIQTVSAKIADTLQSVPLSVIQSAPRILEGTDSDPSAYSAAQKELLSRISQSLFDVSW
jgi:hypothetical protein